MLEFYLKAMKKHLAVNEHSGISKIILSRRIKNAHLKGPHNTWIIYIDWSIQCLRGVQFTLYTVSKYLQVRCWILNSDATCIILYSILECNLLSIVFRNLSGDFIFWGIFADWFLINYHETCFKVNETY